MEEFYPKCNKDMLTKQITTVIPWPKKQLPGNNIVK